VCIESPRSPEQRQEFLRKISALRRDGYSVYYTDETWAGANHTVRYGWQEDVSQFVSTALDFDRGKIEQVNGWKRGIIVPSGAGKSYNLSHWKRKCFFGTPGRNDANFSREKRKRRLSSWDERTTYYREWNGLKEYYIGFQIEVPL
jgi:hypothetical protein